jgi:hypothetical protein
MKLSKLLKIFTSSFYSPYPYILKYIGNADSTEKQRFAIIKNPNYSNESKKLLEGIRFEVLSGSLSNQYPVTQPFVVKILNKNNLNIYNTLNLNLYEVNVGTNNLTLKSQRIISSPMLSEQNVSATVTGKIFLITLEAPDGKVLYTSQDFERGLIPIRQDIFVKTTLGRTETYLPVFYSEDFDEIFSPKNYRTINQKYFSSPSIRIIENANLCDTSPSNVIGDLSIGSVKDYLFSLGYYATDRQKGYVKGATLSLLEFLHDFYNTTKLDIFPMVDISAFPKTGSFYYSSYYIDFDTFIPQQNDYSIDIRNEVIALFLTSFILDSLSTGSVSRFNNKINFLNSMGILPESYVPSFDSRLGGDKLFTNLLYLQVLKNVGNENYLTLKSLIKTTFLENNALELNAPINDPTYISTNQSGIEANIIRVMLPKHFETSEYSTLLPILDDIISSKSRVINYINKNYDPLSESYNPHHQIDLEQGYTFYLHGDYIPFGLNAILYKLLGLKFPSALYTDGGLIAYNMHIPSKMIFILPEFFSSMIYLATKTFYFSDIVPLQPEEEFPVAFVEAKIYGPLLKVDIMLNIPKKVYALLLERSTNYVYKLEFSPVRSLNHTLIFNVSGLNLSNIKLAFIIS